MTERELKCRNYSDELFELIRQSDLSEEEFSDLRIKLFWFVYHLLRREIGILPSLWKAFKATGSVNKNNYKQFVGRLVKIVV